MAISKRLYIAQVYSVGVFVRDRKHKETHLLTRSKEFLRGHQSICIHKNSFLVKLNIDEFSFGKIKYQIGRKTFSVIGEILHIKHYKEKYFLIMTEKFLYLFDEKELKKIKILPKISFVIFYLLRKDLNSAKTQNIYY